MAFESNNVIVIAIAIAWFFPRFELGIVIGFMALFVPVVIGRSNCFGFGFLTIIWKPL